MTKTATKATTKAQPKAKEVLTTNKQVDEQLRALVTKMLSKDSKLITYPVSGYETFKYGNKVLCELHYKKRSISHVTFNDNIPEVKAIISKNNMLSKLGDKTWTLRAECLVTDNLLKNFESIIDASIAQAKPKAEPKETAKKAEKASK